jgi:hypothetical protein
MLANASTEGRAVVDVALPRMMAKTMIIITAAACRYTSRR